MTKSSPIQRVLFLSLLVTLSGCGKSVDPQALTPEGDGPWNGSIYMTRSEDGLHFEGRTLIQDRAGVPNLLALQDGTLVLLYQYFSATDPDLFDVIAYSLSTDDGESWDAMQTVSFADLPDPIDDAKRPMDPTLVQLEDGRLRLYFTYHAAGQKKPALYSATTSNEDIASTFVVDDGPDLAVEDNLLDPAVVYFDGLWHHYTWQMESDDNYHSTSKDGLHFSLQENINLPMDFLGQVIAFDDGLRFYGTGQGGVVTAFSEDGYAWSKDGSSLAQGADPAVQELSDGTFLMMFTSKNFNENSGN